MKRFILSSAIVAIMVSCSTQNTAIPEGAKAEMKAQKNTADDKWEVIVMDPQYDTYINSVAKPMTMYTDESLRARNITLVADWNSRYYSGRNPGFYEVPIDYDPNENYGKEFNYRMYQFFAYLNWKYGVRFQGLSGADTLR